MPGRGRPHVKMRLAPETLALLASRSDRMRCPMAKIAREALIAWLVRQSDVEARPVESAAPVKKPRPLSRPQRLERLRRDVRQILDEYASWQSSLPEFSADSPTAERLTETMEALETAADALDGADPPRGYGRD